MVAISSLYRSSSILLAAASCLTTGADAASVYERATDYVSRSAKLVKRVATDPVLFKYSILRYAFYVNLELGSREDSVNVRLTDQPWLWVGSEKPTNCSRDLSRNNYLQCVYVDWSGLYNPSTSTSFRNVSNAILSLSQSDETRYTRGYYGTDTVKFGQTSLDNVYIGVADNFTQAPELGIGVYDNDRQTFPSFMQFLYQQNEIKSLAHGLYFDWMEKNQSYLNFGSVDTEKYEGNLVTFNASSSGEITTVDLVSAAFGSLGNMKELTAVKSLRANIEFSTSRISLPDTVIQGIVDTAGAEYDDNWGGYLIDCSMRDSDLAFEFRFGDTNITVTANHFILPAFGVLGYRYQLNGQDACSLQLNPMSKYSVATNLGYEAVLGTPFARHTYLVHDYGNRQLSFAPVKFNATAVNIVELDSRGVAPLYSEIPSPTPTDTPTDSPSPQPTGGTTTSKTNTGAIAGGVIAGVAGLSGIALLTWFMMKRRKNQEANLPPPPPMMHQPGGPPPPGPGPQTNYSYVPAYDPTKGVGAYNVPQRPVSELPAQAPAYNWGGQTSPGGHPQFGAPQVPYQENVAPYNYSEAPGNNTFAHELPSSNNYR
ncbi:hypothetical protein H072_2208 [Dactylellina haptotyla CBS 200.50]|uniref:Peptidase A1 domain-containing protein n=1 Tax=Dactylellina haptotyla (strain CBS 200.50) TaxID=1284197 RepID=S8ALM5_DACHA|nr:hypothetical protein H072_2208 [Dactylellina haptotyla CBS 200.50]